MAGEIISERRARSNRNGGRHHRGFAGDFPRNPHGISYALAEAMDEGHCGLPVEELVPLTEKLLEIPAELVETAMRLELEGGAVIADDLEGRRCVFLAGLYRAEREIAEKLNALAIGKPPLPAIDADKAIPWVEQ